MQVHCLQHVPFEGPGSIGPALAARGHELVCIRLFAGDPLPDPRHVRWLLVLGGPMGVHDEAVHPWLVQEKDFLRQVLARAVPVLGICLGAQLLAAALGARVFPNPAREIGWFPVERAPAAAQTRLGRIFPARADVFHWHGDTFELPPGALPLARSTACSNQGFIWRERVLALQFHLETTAGGVQSLITHCGHELDGSSHVQAAADLLAHPARFAAINRLMEQVLAIQEAQAGESASGTPAASVPDSRM